MGDEMSWSSYAITWAALFACYCLIRWFYSREFGPSLFPLRHKNSREMNGHGIDAAPVVDRVQHVRAGMKNGKPPARQLFKREVLIANRRAEIAKHSYFSPAPKTEHLDDETTLLLIL